jgi:hypothetical protein
MCPSFVSKIYSNTNIAYRHTLVYYLCMNTLNTLMRQTINGFLPSIIIKNQLDKNNVEIVTIYFQCPESKRPHREKAHR